MKSVAIIVLLFIITFLSRAQGVFSNQTSNAIQKVIQDYPNSFRNIKGSILIKNPQATDYTSTITIPGALSCTITEYSSSQKKVVSWQADVMEMEDFDLAKKKYKEIFSQLKNTIVKLEGEKPYILNGQYASPDESKKFHSILFTLLPAGQLQKVIVELSFEYVMPLWKIRISIYDRDRNDEEQGAIIER